MQRLDLRLNEEHPPLAKVLAALPLVLRGVHADYSHISWTVSEKFFHAGQWVFGEWLLTKWNNPVTTLVWARLPMLLLTLALGWIVYACERRLAGNWGGLLCLSIYVSTPAFLSVGPLVHTDMAVTLFSLVTLWRFAETWQNPSRKNAVLFGLTLSAALLSKFTAGILFFAFVASALSTRWRALPGQPIAKPEARAEAHVSGKWTVGSGLSKHDHGWPQLRLADAVPESTAGWWLHVCRSTTGAYPGRRQRGRPSTSLCVSRIWGAPFDLRGSLIDVIRHPERPKAIEEMQARFNASKKTQSPPPPPSTPK